MANGFRTLFAAIGIVTAVIVLLWLVTGHSDPDAKLDSNPQPDAVASNAPVKPAPPPVATPAPPQRPLDPATTPNVYHATDANAMMCNEPKITAEVQDAMDHPGTLSEDVFLELGKQGHCVPMLSLTELFTVTRQFEFQVPAGIVKMAEATEKLSDGSDIDFYILQNRIVLVSEPAVVGVTGAVASPPPSDSDNSASSAGDQPTR